MVSGGQPCPQFVQVDGRADSGGDVEEFGFLFRDDAEPLPSDTFDWFDAEAGMGAAQCAVGCVELFEGGDGRIVGDRAVERCGFTVGFCFVFEEVDALGWRGDDLGADLVESLFGGCDGVLVCDWHEHVDAVVGGEPGGPVHVFGVGDVFWLSGGMVGCEEDRG